MSNDLKEIQKKVNELFKATDELGWSRALIYDKDNQLIDNLMVIGNSKNVEMVISELQQRPLEKLINTMILQLGNEETQRILDLWKKA